TLVEVARIKDGFDTGSIDVSPVEATVQNIEAKIAVHHQVVLVGQVGGQAKNVGALLPCGHGGIGSMRGDEKIHVLEQKTVSEFLVQMGEAFPGFNRAVDILLIHQEMKKGDEGIATGRHDIAQQRVRIGTHPPAGEQRGVHQGKIVLDDDAELAQGAVDLAVNQKK